jgi:hypothetical protein
MILYRAVLGLPSQGWAKLDNLMNLRKAFRTPKSGS